MQLYGSLNIFGIAFLQDWNENWPFQSCGHCWHIECSTFTASSFKIWNSSTGIPSPPLASAVCSCHLLFDHFQFALIHGPDVPGSYAVMLLTAPDFTPITSHTHNRVSFLLWLHLCILSGVISPLVSSSILSTYWPGEFIFQCPTFCLVVLFMGFSRQEYWSGLPFPPPVDHVLSDLSTMTHLSWVAPQGMAYSFIKHILRFIY